MKKILHLITRLDTGGSAENVILSARGLAQRGYDVLVASGPSAQLSDEAEKGGFSFREVPSLVREIRPFKDSLAFLEVLRLYAGWEPDIIHTHSSKAGILGRWAASVYNRSHPERARVVHTPHGHVFYGYFGPVKSAEFLWLEKTAASRTDKLIALTEGEMRESVERGVGRSDQWVVIHSGVRTDAPSLDRAAAKRRLASSYGISSRSLIVGTVARLEPIKGIATFLDAVAELAGQNSNPSGVHFLIVGDGPLMPALQKHAKERGIADKVTFIGHQDDVLSWMRAMDVYVQPSLNEGMGKTLVYAQTLGIPVIASRVCGIPDVVWEGKTGILVAPADSHALANAIGRLVKDEDLRSHFSKAAPAWISRADETGFPAFSVDAMVVRLVKLYSGL